MGLSLFQGVRHANRRLRTSDFGLQNETRWIYSAIRNPNSAMWYDLARLHRALGSDNLIGSNPAHHGGVVFDPTGGDDATGQCV